MTDTEKVILYTRVLDSWGVNAQVDMVMEEAGEMLAALGKGKRGRVSREEIITEIADVSIMMEQMAVYFGLDEFLAEKDRKLLRLKDRLEQWESNRAKDDGFGVGRQDPFMIGDYFQTVEDGAYVKIVGVYFDKNLANGSLLDLEVISTGCIQYNNAQKRVKPIPITREILEKSGFGKGDALGLMDEYFDFTIREWSDSIWVLTYECTEMDTPPEQISCSYIHELQHFLKYVCIDHDIKL